MFGLMRPEKSCPNNAGTNYHFHRMHYCGICKSLGKQYGHRSRLLLNFDTVFLAEILSRLSEEDLTNWPSGYQAVNQCFTMPDNKQAVPLTLEYAAAINILLGQLKMEDNKMDEPGVKWKLLSYFFTKTFRKTDRQLQEIGINTYAFWDWVEIQKQREKSACCDFSSVGELLDYYATPTAQMTGLAFENGATFICQGKQCPMMYQLGYQYGRLVYMLDAFEDVEKDLSQNQFNPLTKYYKAQRTLQDDQFGLVRQVILKCQEAVVQQIEKLPFSKEMIAHYSALLRSNIALRIYRERRIPKSLKEQLQYVWHSAIREMREEIPSLTSLVHRVHYYLISLVIFVIPLAADYSNPTDKVAVYKWTAVLIAFMASIGLGRYVVKHRKGKIKRQIRKAKRKIRRFFQFLWVKKFFSKKSPCCTDEDTAAVFLLCCCEPACECYCYHACEQSRTQGSNTLLLIGLILFVIAIVVLLMFPL